MNTDRQWMYRRLSNGLLTDEFVKGLDEFIAFACSNEECMDGSKIKCPCSAKKCSNRRYLEVEEVKNHLMRKGFIGDYLVWNRHGEEYEPSDMISEGEGYENSGYATEEGETTETYNPYRTMVMDVAGPSFDDTNMDEPPNPGAQKIFDMLNAAEKELWEGSSHSQLSVVSRLLSIKSEHHLSERCYDEISSLMKETMPEDNCMVEGFYETKKLVRGLGLPVEKIHCCEQGCMIYWKDDIHLTCCKFCGRDRYKPRKEGGKLVPYKKMYYFPLTPRLQRLYLSEATASDMRWHAEHDQSDGIMKHPSDSKAWKHFSEVHPSFAEETRNVRLGLCTDGFAPFGVHGKHYSSWPVIVTPYNLPPSMCMKEEFMFLTIIVPGKSNPKQMIDVYLQPLIAELQELWTVGFDTYDASLKKNFVMRAALMWTISDFPAYSMLSGWSTAGKLACPYCMENTNTFQLPNGGKTSWFDNHRKFLPMDHPYRTNKNWFTKNKMVHEPPPPIRTGEEIIQHIEELGLMKVTELGGNEHNEAINNRIRCGWKKRSIFWDLPYWRTLLIRHNLDVMHIEKNVFDNLFDTVMAVPGRTKDNIKAREDIKLYCRRKELEFDTQRGKYPKACYSLEKDGKQCVCTWLKQVLFPDGYVSNLGRSVDMRQFKLFGLKSHDCHIFMQRLIPIAFRELLPNKVWEALTEVSMFFKSISSSKTYIDDMDRLEKEIPIILCKLERIFPPSLFDSMEHLLVHLPYEAKIAGPVQYRWMYPFERFLRHLKLNVKNKAKVEGSIANAYLVEEASYFCQHYFEPHVHTKYRKVSRNDDGGGVYAIPGMPYIFNHPGRPFGKHKKRWLGDDEYLAAQTYILLNCKEVQTYRDVFIEEVRASDPNISETSINQKIDSDFASWFNNYATQFIDNEFIKDLASGPLRKVDSYGAYFVNGYNFHTKSHASNRSTDNSGVCIKAINYDESSTDYYGILKEVLILEYPALPIKRVTLFNCDWFDPTPAVGTRVHRHYDLVDVNFKRKLPPYEPFVLAMQAEQVCYVPYPTLGHSSRRDNVDWHAVCKIKARAVFEISETNATETFNDTTAFQDDEPIRIATTDATTAVGDLNDQSGVFADLDEGNNAVNEDEPELILSEEE